MDGYKRPFRGSKIYVHKKDDEDKTLVNLYKESEYAKENATADIDEGEHLKPPKSPNIKNLLDDEEEANVPQKSRKTTTDDADPSGEDIDEFIDDSESIDEEDVPIKKSVKKERKKQRQKEKREKTAKTIIAKVIGSLIIIALLVFGGLWFFRPSFIENTLDDLNSEKAVADEIYYSPLTGLETKPCS